MRREEKTTSPPVSVYDVLKSRPAVAVILAKIACFGSVAPDVGFPPDGITADAAEANVEPMALLYPAIERDVKSAERDSLP